MQETISSTPSKPASSSSAELVLDHIKGLPKEVAEARLKAEGFNELAHQKPRNIFAIVFGVIKEPMFIMLMICAILCFVLKDYEEGGMLSLFVFFIIGISVYQERKSERALDALKDLSAPRATVIRSNEQVTVAGREVVRGDFILLKEGDRVAADIAILWSMNLSADESLLTGECVPVRKSAMDSIGDYNEVDLDTIPAAAAPGGDDTPSCFMGSMIVSGKGLGIVQTIGHNTSLGKIGKSLADVKEEKTPLEKETNRLVLIMAAFGLAVSATVFLYWGIKYDIIDPADNTVVITVGSGSNETSMSVDGPSKSWNDSPWIQGALTALTLAMGLLPEEFPVVLTVFLSLGAWRISKSDVLTRKNSAIETLGACTVLCTDKTGTLTMNQMMVQAVWSSTEGGEEGHVFMFRNPNDQEERVDEECHEVVEYALLSSQRDPFDPMETALWRLINNKQVDAEHGRVEWDVLKEYPLSKEMLAMTRVYHTAGSTSNTMIAAVKGAPESVADLSHLPPDQLERMRKAVDRFASMGLRVLGVAKCEHTVPAGELPVGQHDFPFTFLGLVAFVDPIRPTVPAAVKVAYKAGMRVVMITGDYPTTAKSIAEKIGLFPRDKVITGPELDQMTDEELAGKIKDVTIFARVIPEQKLQIVKAFKARGEIVAMTGDGVNDAPALKAAHIGVAMGMRGTDVAREAAHLVLLDDDFSSIVKAVALGRRIYDNLQKAMSYIISIHIPLAGMVLLPVLFGWSPIFHAVHIVFLEMVIDPACSVVLEAEPEEPGLMNRKPRNTKESMVSIPTAIVAFIQGGVILTLAILGFYFGQQWGMTENQARGFTFALIIISNVGLIVEDRSWEQWLGRVLIRPNKPMWVVFIVVLPALALVLWTPGIIKLFAFEGMPLVAIPVFLGLGIAGSLWFEFYKLGRRWWIAKFHTVVTSPDVEMSSASFNHTVDVIEVEPSKHI